ncbi:hypothetical protein HYC85_007161 [Camellia sinensis]|uniref:Uncharacterized protein n=1 Tax=Camellia sinensis TaxID=4442 RepID=A0A7J7HP32_CAMSI|nr:hypothetical protein HYC85_007161 [Camellia sinensis]
MLPHPFFMLPHLYKHFRLFSYGRLLCSVEELQSRPKLPTGATRSAAARGFQCYNVAHVKNGPSLTSPWPTCPWLFHTGSQ